MVREKKNRVCTSIKIIPDIWSKAKIAAIRENITVSEFVESAIINYLNSLEFKKLKTFKEKSK